MSAIAAVRDGAWIQIGRHAVSIWHPDYSNVTIQEFAWSLANINRFTGCAGRYSDAQHSVYVSQRCDPVDAMWGLLHDCTEWALGDVSSPLKRIIPQYRAIERIHQIELCRRFSLRSEMPESVHVADMRMMMTEARDLLPPAPRDWGIGYEPYPDLNIERITEMDAYYRFLHRWHSLGGALR